MDLYVVLLFVHILAAVVLVGGSLVSPLLSRRMTGAPSVATLRAHAGVAAAISRVVGPSAAIVLAAGIGMWVMKWPLATGWIAVSLVLFTISGVLAGGVADPVLRRLVAAADAADDGPLTADLHALTHDPRLNGAHSLLLTMDIAIVALMTMKPALAPSMGLAVAAVLAGAVLAGAVLIVGERRHTVAAPAA